MLEAYALGGVGGAERKAHAERLTGRGSLVVSDKKKLILLLAAERS